MDMEPDDVVQYLRPAALRGLHHPHFADRFVRDRVHHAFLVRRASGAPLAGFGAGFATESSVLVRPLGDRQLRWRL